MGDTVMKLRRTMLYMPGSQPGMLTDASIYGADSIMIDLEDSVTPAEKDTARFMTFNALKTIDFGTEIIVRINGLDTEHGVEDIKACVHGGVDVIRLPKTETAEDIKAVERIVESIEKEYGYEVGRTGLMAAIESPLGVANAREIAMASKRLIGIALGAEDYVTSVKTKRYADGMEVYYARQQVLIAARIAGIQAIDTVYSDVSNEEGLRAEAQKIRQYGFDGKSVIHPSQIKIVHDVYKPTNEEIKHSEKVLYALEEAEKTGVGVITVNGKMVDKAMIERAERIVVLSKEYIGG